MDKTTTTTTFVNATKICRSNHKNFDKYYKRPETKRFIRELTSAMAKTEDDIIIREADGTVWVHPQVAIHMIHYVAPKMEVEITREYKQPLLTGLYRVMDAMDKTTAPEMEPSDFDRAMKRALNFNPKK